MNVFAQLLTLIDQNDLDGAEALMRQTRLDSDTQPQALYVQGLVAYARDDKRLAKVKFARAAKAAPGFAPPLIALGNAALALGEHDAALRAYKSALALEPNNAAILSNIGAVENALGSLEAAEATLKRALELAPDNAATKLNLAQVLRRRGDGPAALAVLAEMGDTPAAAELRDVITRQQAEGSAAGATP